MGRQNEPLMVLDPLREGPGNLWYLGIRLEELQKTLVLLGQGHDLGRGWKHAHVKRSPVDVSGGERVANEIT